MKLKSNRIQCLKCNETIESKFTHDFKWCGCGSVAIDGGLDYRRVIGNREDWKDESEFTVTGN